MENFKIQNKTTERELKNAEECLNALIQAIAFNKPEKVNSLKHSLLELHKQIAKASASETQLNITQMISTFNKNI